MIQTQIIVLFLMLFKIFRVFNTPREHEINWDYFYISTYTNSRRNSDWLWIYWAWGAQFTTVQFVQYPLKLVRSSLEIKRYPCLTLFLKNKFKFKERRVSLNYCNNKIVVKKGVLLNLACLGVCLFVSNKPQNGWTDRTQILCGTLRDHFVKF